MLFTGKNIARLIQVIAGLLLLTAAVIGITGVLYDDSTFFGKAPNLIAMLLVASCLITLLIREFITNPIKLGSKNK